MLELTRDLYPYLKRYLKYIIAAIFLSVLLAGVKFYQVKLIKPIFDKGLSADSLTTDVWHLAGILLGLGLINVPIRFYHYFWMRYVVDKAACDIREKLYLNLQHQPLTYYQNSKQGELISKIVYDAHVLTIGGQGIVDILRESMVGIAMLGLAFYRDWQLTIVVLVVAPLFAFIFYKSGGKVRAHQSNVQKYTADMTHSAAEGISGQKIAKAFNLQEYIVKRFNFMQGLYFKSQMKATKVEEIASPSVEFVGNIAFSAVIILGHFRITSGAMTTGDFVSFVAALALLMDPIRKFSRANIKINQARGASDRVFGLMKLSREKNNGNKLITSLNRSIVFDDVSFSYGDQEVLSNFTLNIKKGEKVALVGLSGAGKSTLINLILRLYQIDRGSIALDGIPLEEIELQSLRGLFSLVSQDIFLFNDTVFENLTIGKERSEAEIDKALEIAHAKDFIKRLPDGLKTIIGDRGTKLSGGQAQRLTLARAMLEDSPILLFDEATSALDNESEKLVQKAMSEMSKEKTVITVAHRLSTIYDYDQIIVMKEGRIVESGKHLELLALEGEYSKLHRLGQSEV